MADDLPRHIAIIMDGNGRWARQRRRPRISGHRAGVEAVRNTVSECARLGIGTLTLFAFSSENWRRPRQEVSFLMDLFVSALESEADKLNENNIRLRVIGDRSAFPARLQECIHHTEGLTAANDGLNLVIAANYGGRWDICQAARHAAMAIASGDMPVEALDEGTFARFLALADLPEPDLFIRTGGEQRVSNFLLWQLAYTELYFTDLLWPDFDAEALARAIDWYRARERRFGQTSEQLQQAQG